MADVLEQPALVIKDKDAQDRDALLFMKSYKKNEKTKMIVSVVVDKNGVNVSVSTHEKEINNAVNKIKRPEQVIYDPFGLTGGNADR